MGLSTREMLLLLIDDMELVAKELIENITPKQKKSKIAELTELVDLLMAKHEEFRKMLVLADEQAKLEQKIEELQATVDVHDRAIVNFYERLREYETILLKEINEARQILADAKHANRNPLSTEDLVTYAHRISSAHAVSAPLDWCIGDVRRPYPTDLQMRNGLISKPHGNVNDSEVATEINMDDTQNTMNEQPNAIETLFNWTDLGEMQISMDSEAMHTLSQIETAEDDGKSCRVPVLMINSIFYEKCV